MTSEPVPSPPAGYLDAVGGQPLLPEAERAWRAAAGQAWSDPARLHHEGRRAGLVLDAARTSLAASLGQVLGCSLRPDEVFLTTSGPTGVGVAVQALLEQGTSDRAVASAVESLAVLSPARRWAARLDLVPVSASGRVDLAAFTAALAEPAALACLQAANGEVGTRQPVAEAAACARAAGVPLLVHAIQVVGREPVPEGWDVLVASARDWGGPAGVGVLVVRGHVRWTPEENPDRGWVVGFPDVPGAAAAASALDWLAPRMGDEADRARQLTAAIRDRLPSAAEGIVVAGDPDDRLPHIVTFTCEGVVGEVLVGELARRGYSVASGSACTSDVRMPSQVLAAMGLAADASVRVSLPFGVTDATVEGFLDALPDAVAAARGALP